RNVRVQARFANADGALRPGMFVDVAAHNDAAVEQHVTVPASAILYNPYGNSVFVVDDIEGENGETYKGVRQEFVQTGAARGDQIALLSGVEPGDEVVTSGVFKLRNGAAVLVNNEVQPGNDPAPQPTNT